MTSLLLRSAPGTSADLFHAVPLDILDPFLYAEHDGRKVAVWSATGSKRSGSASRCSTRSRSGSTRSSRRASYRPGFGGCRLEDLVLVTEDGAEVLTDFPYSLSP